MKTIPLIAVAFALLLCGILHAADPFLPEESLNIGEVKHQGSVAFDGTIHRLNGSGAEIYGPEDSFFFTFRDMPKDATITARFVEGLQFVDPWAKAGLMIRAGREPGAPNVFFGLTSQNGLVLQNRDVDGADTAMRQPTGGEAMAELNKGVWLRLSRQGDHLVASKSADGQTWEEFGALANVQLGDAALFGLAMSAHDENQQFGFATFDNVAIVEGTP